MLKNKKNKSNNKKTKDNKNKNKNKYSQNNNHQQKSNLFKLKNCLQMMLQIWVNLNKMIILNICRDDFSYVIGLSHFFLDPQYVPQLVISSAMFVGSGIEDT